MEFCIMSFEIYLILNNFLQYFNSKNLSTVTVVPVH